MLITNTDRITVSLLSGTAAVALSYVMSGSTRAFVAAPINRALVTTMPSSVVTFSIVTLGDLGTVLGFAMAITMSILLFAIVAYLSTSISTHVDTERTAPLLVAGLGAVLAGVLSRDFFSAVGIGAVMGLVFAISVYVAGDASHDGVSLSRRWNLRLTASTVVLGGLGYGLHAGSQEGEPIDLERSHREQVQSLFDEAERRSFDIAGIPGLVSDVDEFYEVDINSVNPKVQPGDWTLTIDGNTERNRSFSYEELRRFEPTHRFVTIRCVGDSLNGDKMDTALWTGVPLDTLLDEAGPIGEYAMLHAVDGYYVEVPVDALRSGLLAYGMNGDRLTSGHGFPARVLTPGRWGETNIKWVSRIEIVDEQKAGYWEKRGWYGTGQVNMIAKLWSVETRDDGMVQLAGHAYAGLRGVGRVEVSTDSGETWTDATLSEPPPSTSDAPADVWRQWTFEWTPEQGTHEVIVRAVDREGNVQRKGMGQPYPNGAEGRVSKWIEV